MFLQERRFHFPKDNFLLLCPQLACAKFPREIVNILPNVLSYIPYFLFTGKIAGSICSSIILQSSKFAVFRLKDNVMCSEMGQMLLSRPSNCITARTVPSGLLWKKEAKKRSVENKILVSTVNEKYIQPGLDLVEIGISLRNSWYPKKLKVYP